MRRRSFLPALIMAASLNSSAVFAELPTGPIAVTVSGTAKTVVPATLSNPTDINFGSFTSSTMGGTLSTGGATTGDVIRLTNSPLSSFTAEIGGDANREVIINYSTTAITLKGPAGAAPMTAELRDANLSSPPPGSIRIGSGGNSALITAAILTVGPNQEAGSYSGSFSVSVSY